MNAPDPIPPGFDLSEWQSKSIPTTAPTGDQDRITDSAAESSRQRAVRALDKALEAGGVHQPFVKWDELIEALEAEGWEFRG